MSKQKLSSVHLYAKTQHLEGRNCPTLGIAIWADEGGGGMAG